jgi:glycosyltransferase involved in cell wall biosynthesis
MAWDAIALKRGGVDVSTLNFVSALAEHARKHDYFVLLNKHEAAWDSRDWPDHVQFTSIDAGRLAYYKWRLAARINPPSGDLWDAHRVWEIDHTAARLGLDYIHYPATTIWPLEIAAPCTLTFWDMQHEYFPQFFSAEERADREKNYRASINKARHVFVPSQYTLDTLQEKYGALNASQSLLPAGPGRLFQPAIDAEIIRVRKKYDLPDSFVFYPARFWAHKNHAVLLQAQHLYRERFNQPLHLVFSGGEAEEFQAAQEHGSTNGTLEHSHVLGLVPETDLPALYSAADAMVFPSLFEGFGIPLVEAMACGCPVAAARTTSIPEVVGDAALLFDPTNPLEICDALRRLAVDADLRASLDSKARLRLKRFGWDSIIKRFESVLAELPGKRAQPQESAN